MKKRQYPSARRSFGGVRGSLAAIALSVVLALMTASCSLSPGPMSTSLRQASGGQKITVSFANIVNLPEGADVTLNGTKVGSVNSVLLRSDHVDAITTLKDDVRIPTAAQASIRQDTVLGDPYVAIETPGESGTDYLNSGGVIPTSSTTSPPTLEDTLAVLANFINGGSVQNMQDVIRSVNTALPDIDQTRRVADIAAVDMKDLAGGTERIDDMLAALDATAASVIPRLDDITDMFSPEGMQYWGNISEAFEQLGVVIPSIGSVFEGGYWLVPMLSEVNGSIYTVRDGIDAIGSNDIALRKFLSDKLFPFVRRPSMDIVSATTPDGQQVLANIEKVLRMLGAIQ